MVAVNKYPAVLTMKDLFFPCVYSSYNDRPLWWVSYEHAVTEGNKHSPLCHTITIRQRFSEVHVTLQSKWIGQCTRTGEVSRIGMKGICVGQWNRSGGTQSLTGPHLWIWQVWRQCDEWPFGGQHMTQTFTFPSASSEPTREVARRPGRGTEICGRY